MSFFTELKRRNVFRVGIAYTVTTWLLIQVSDTVFPRIGLPDSVAALVIALLIFSVAPVLISIRPATFPSKCPAKECQ